jgi:hypothetical protein
MSLVNGKLSNAKSEAIGNATIILVAWPQVFSGSLLMVPALG